MLAFDAKKQFFSGASVRAAMEESARVELMMRGGYLRKVAKNSMRKPTRNKTASAPGEPPLRQRGDLHRLLYFYWDPATKSVVVGPSLFGSKSAPPGTIPGVLERGGMGRAHKNHRRIMRKIGDGGEIRLFGRPSKTTKKAKIVQAAATSRMFGAVERPVTYIKIRTQAQADRANRINEELYGPATLPAQRIAPRPYMKPAFEKTLALKSGARIAGTPGS